jgi:uncharacterized Zn-binding protein involved in type VI secretion
MPEAARITDQIGHTSALAGLLMGAAAGVLLAVAVIAVVGTGGVAAVAIGAGIAAAGASGAMAGAYIGQLIPTSPTGAITIGSMNVLIGGVTFLAARAGLDMSACSGIVMPHGTPLIAQGSATVLVNNMMAARNGDKLVCGASISSGCSSVIIGGPTATVPGLSIADDVPPWAMKALFAVMVAGTVIATGGAAAVFGLGPALGGLFGGLGGSLVLGWIGEGIGGAIGEQYGNERLGGRIGKVAGGVIGGLFGGFGGARLVEGTPVAATGTTEPPSRFTYRGDDRSPDVIFNEGFAPRGSSKDLMAHALNNTDPPSAYVSTSKSPEVAGGFSDNVYVVRSNNGVDVNETLGSSSPFPNEQEVAIPGGVPASNVRAVTYPNEGVSILNPNYKP